MPADRVLTREPPVPDGDALDVAGAGVWNLSKVTPPTLSRVFPNRRLFERLDAALAKPVIWIHGPPGAGKTTLAASYLAARGHDPLWYRLDPGDADPATLFVYLAAARRPGGRRLPLLTPEYRGALPLFARRFFGEYLSCPRIPAIVFDDYHEVAPEAVVHACFAAGLEEVPSGKHVIVVSRTPPPPSLARLRVNGVVAVIEPEALRVTPDEAEGLVRAREAEAESASIAHIVRQTQGWTAGVILMLEADEARLPVVGADASVPEVLFEYFAGEVLQRLEPHVQRLLCAVALMPTATAAAAAQLTGQADAGAILEDLRRRNYFTTRDAGAEPHYRFHPLFRDYLLNSLREHVSGRELDDLRIRAAAVLDADGQTDAAIGLLAEAGALDLLATLVKRRAPALADEHRLDTLAAWLEHLTDALIHEDGWLSYWFGTAYVQSQSGRSLDGFGRAFALFEAAGDVTGQFVAWAGQAQAVWTDAFGTMTRFDALIVSLRDLVLRHPDFPSPAVALKVASLMSTALTRRGNDRAEIVTWQRRALAAAEQTAFAGRSEELGFMSAINDMQDAKFAAAKSSLAALPDPLTLDHLPFIQTPGLIAHTMQMIYRQAEGDVPAYAEAAIRRIENAGNYRWVPIIAGFAASDAVRRSDLKAAGEWLRRMGTYADRVAPKRGAQYHYITAQFHLLKGELGAARQHADIAVESGVRSGWYLFEAYSRAVRTEILIEAAELEAAEVELDRVRDALAKSASKILSFPAGLLEANLRFAQGAEGEGLAALAAAMALGRREGFRSGFLTRPCLARLYAKALAADIEPDFVRVLVRASEVPPPEDADEAWPWPLKIVTFGGLRVEVNGEPLAFSRKTPKRLLTLLKAILAYGGAGVPAEKLIDAVWPDEEGDAGHQALRIAVHRLSRLLGEAAAVTMRGGSVGLDPAGCWLDLWSFERGLARRGPNESAEDHRRRLERGLALYRGDFLAGDDDLWWTIERRDRLREMYRKARGNPESPSHYFVPPSPAS